MMRRTVMIGVVISFWLSAYLFQSCSDREHRRFLSSELSDESLLDSVQYRTFLYFWEGADPESGMALERIHLDSTANPNDRTVTTGGSGFGIMAIVSGMERGYITREEGLLRLTRIVDFLERADSFHGAFPHWLDGGSGRVIPFGRKDNGADLVETAFLMQGILSAVGYLQAGSVAECALSSRMDELWRRVEWDWFCRGDSVLFWHWSPDYSWEMNFPVRGYNECLIMYLLATASPTHAISPDVYCRGWADNGRLIEPHSEEGYELRFRYQGGPGVPLFWAHYSFLGLDPRGLKDRYQPDYFEEMKNLSLANRAYCIRNPRRFKKYGEDCWGLTACYSIEGYAAHAPNEKSDLGVISPTAALSSIVYVSEFARQALRNFFNRGDCLWGKYGFYDAFSDTESWYPKRYLAIDQGPIVIMIENYRSQLFWKLFMGHPDVQNGLKRLGFESPHLSKREEEL